LKNIICPPEKIGREMVGGRGDTFSQGQVKWWGGHFAVLHYEKIFSRRCDDDDDDSSP
jgi:hypothetical protein